MRKLFYVFKTIRGFLSRQQLRTIYYGLAFSIIKYGIILWGSASRSYVRKVQIMQNRILKIILNKNLRYPTSLLYHKFEVRNISQIYLFQSCVHVFCTGIRNEHVAVSSITRNFNSSRLLLPKVNSEFYRRNAYVRALRFLFENDINPFLFPNLSAFKKKLSGYFL